MRETQAALASAAAGVPTPRFHHVGIQTTDLDNSIRFYEDFLGCTRAWTLDQFSELTRSRLPGITTLAEMVLGDIRIHLFERPGAAADPATSSTEFQHFCLAVDDPADLYTLHGRWTELYGSGRFTFALDEPPTEIVVDGDGVVSFYAYDVNGLELEFTYLPSGMS